MTVALSVEGFNSHPKFSRYPMTVEDKGWVYGVWYCGTSWTPVRLHGQYPPGFVDRALSLFPGAADVLHVPSGTLGGLPSGHVTVDAIRDETRQPMVRASADALPFAAESFDLVLADPPYTPEDAARYGCLPFPLKRSIEEARRVLRPGGFLGVLHTYYPAYRGKDWRLRGLIAVVTGFARATRMFSIFEKRCAQEVMAL